MRFREISFTTDEIQGVQKTPSGRHMILYVNGQAFLLKSKRGVLSKFLNILGLNVRGWSVERVNRKLLLKETRFVLSYIENKNGLHYVYRVVTDEYVPVPHRVLFEFCKKTLKEAGISFRERLVRYTRSVGMFFSLKESESMVLGEPVSTGVLVTNANTGARGIRVVGVVEVLSCNNGSVIPNVIHHTSRRHIKSLNAILRKVGNDLLQATRRVLGLSPDDLLSSLLTGEDVKKMVDELRGKLSRYGTKYVEYFDQQLDRYSSRYGVNKVSVWQALTATTSITNGSEEVYLRLARLASSLL